MALQNTRFTTGLTIYSLIFMCVFGYSKVYLIFAILYSLQLNTDDFDVSSLSEAQLYFFAGVLLGLLSFIQFSYKHSRRIYISVSELLYAAALMLNDDYSNIDEFTFILFGASIAITLVIYPLYLSEQSYDEEKHSLTIYLPYSFIIGAIEFYFLQQYQDGKSNQYTTGAISFIAVVYGVLYNYGTSIKETMMKQFMCGQIDRGMSTVSRLIQPDSRNYVRKYFFENRLRKFFLLPTSENYLLNRLQLIEIVTQLPQQVIPLLQKNERLKTIRMTLLTCCIPLTGAYYYQYNIITSDIGTTSQLSSDIVLILFALFVILIGKTVIQRKNHFRMLIIGFKLLFILSVVASLEDYLQDPQYKTFIQAINYGRFCIVQLMIEPVWQVMVIHNVNPKFIWVHQLLYWGVFILSYLSSKTMNQNILQAIAGFAGYMLTSFF